MKTLVLQDDYIPSHRRFDVSEMRDALERIGFRISNEHMYAAWQRYSESMAASWMTPPKDEWSIFYSINSEVHEVDNGE